MPSFTPGLELSRALYADAVQPLLAERFPHLRYSVARIGPGSEVLGFDTPRSADHEWGPRLQLFLQPGDLNRYGDDLRAVLANGLPKEILGWPTNFEGVGAGIGRIRQANGPVEESTRFYYERPFLVIGADRFAAALADGLRGTDLEDLPLIGNIDQFVDNTAVLTEPRKARSVAAERFWRAHRTSSASRAQSQCRPPNETRPGTT